MKRNVLSPQGKYATADGWTKDIMRDVLHTNILSQMNVGLPMTTDADGNGVLMSAHQLVAEPEHIPEGLKELLLFYYFYDGQRPKVPFTDLGLFGCFLCYGTVQRVVYRHQVFTNCLMSFSFRPIHVSVHVSGIVSPGPIAMRSPRHHLCCVSEVGL